MRSALLMMTVVFCSMLLGCGSVNNNQARHPKSINRNDPMMNSHYLSSRVQH